MSILKTLQFILSHPLNKKNKNAAVARFIQWQISSRISPGEIVYHWIGDTRVIARKGEHGFNQNIYCGLQEFSEMMYLLHVIEPTDIFIDIGANIGSYTVLAGGFKGIKCYCFEPIPSTYIRLLDNLRLNNMLDVVKAFNLGVGEKEDELLFTYDKNTTNHIAVVDEHDKNLIKVKVLPLDSLITEIIPTIVKIDVEGAEMMVLNGMKSILEQSILHSVIIELNGSGTRYGYQDQDIINKMSIYGFNTFTYEPFTRKLVPLSHKKITNSNCLFLRNEDMLQQRLRNASPVEIMNYKI